MSTGMFGNRNQTSLHARQLLYVLAIIRFLLPFFLQNSYYQPHRDEYLYLAEGHHMAWGYMEVPPLLSVFAWITNLMGSGMFWIKVWPALFGSLTFLLTGNIVILLGGRFFAILLCWLPFVLDGYLRLFFLFQPNFLDVFFWTAMAYTLIRYAASENNKWLYLFGLSLGLGMMSKYSVAFYGFSLVVALAFSPIRKVFGKKAFYISLGLAFLIFLPNLLWQYQHRFPVIHHMKELQEEQLKNISARDFIIDQFVMNMPCVYIWISGLLFILFRAAGKPYRFIAFSYVLVMGLLVYLSGKSYYALGVYPVLFAFGAIHLEKITALRAKWSRYLMLIYSFSLGLFIIPLVLPIAKPDTLTRYYEKTKLNKVGDFKWEDQERHPLPQDFADMIGWKEMAMQAGAIYNRLPAAEKAKTAVYCRGYYTAGALNYYRKEAGLPEVISDDASFLLWLPDTVNIRNLLLVGHNLPDKDDKVFNQFEKVTVMDTVKMPLFRENGMKIILFENGKDSLNRIIEKAIAQLKSQYSR